LYIAFCVSAFYSLVIFTEFIILPTFFRDRINSRV